jgi:hypothetical protein
MHFDHHWYKRYTEFRMILLLHAPVLCALMALQFHAAGLDKPSAFWRQFSRVLMVVALAAEPVCLYFGDVVAIRAAIVGLIIAAAGFAGYRRIDFVTRWFRLLSLASWCLCIIAVCGMIGVIFARRFFT